MRTAGAKVRWGSYDGAACEAGWGWGAQFACALGVKGVGALGGRCHGERLAVRLGVTVAELRKEPTRGIYAGGSASEAGGGVSVCVGALPNKPLVIPTPNAHSIESVSGIQ